MDLVPTPIKNLELVEAEIVNDILLPQGSSVNPNSTLLDYYFPNRQRIVGVEQLISLWVSSGDIKSESSRRTYRQVACELSSWLVDTYNIPDLRLCTLGHLQAFLTYLAVDKPVRNKRSAGLTKNAIAKYTAAIRSLWRFGSKPAIGYFAFNIAEELPIRWENKLPERVLSERTIWQLEETAKRLSPRHWLVFNLLFYSGCRVGEVGKGGESKGLFWRQLRIDGDCLLFTIQGKGNRTRTITLDPETSAMLLASRGDATDNDPVFKSQSNRDKGKPLTDRAIRRIIEDISSAAGIRFSCHWLRHSHATLAKKRGASDFDLQTQLGHSSPATTARYIHLTARKGTSHLLRQD